MAHKYFFMINFRFVTILLKKELKRLVEEVEKLKVNARDTQWISPFCAVSQSQIYLDFSSSLPP